MSEQAGTASDNDHILWVHDLGWDGRGVARRQDGRVVMVAGALPGDSVKVRIDKDPAKGPLEASAVALVDESPQRVAHPCPHYSQGCPASQLGAVRREFSLEWKRDHLVETLRRIGGLDGVPVEAVIPSPKQWRYRERLEFTIERDEIDGLKLGYKGPDGLVPIIDCRLGALPIRTPLIQLRRSLQLLDSHLQLGSRVPLRLLMRDDGRGGAIAVLFVLTRGPVDNRPLEEWLSTADLTGWEIRRARNAKLRFVNSEKVISSGDPTVKLMIAGRDLVLDSTVFSQVNRAAAHEMTELILEQVPDGGQLLDLYGGFGGFALEYAVRGGEATVIDSAPMALNAGRAYVKQAGLPVEFREMDLGRDDLSGIPFGDYIAAILDPPHSGADSQVIDALNERGPERLIYVSCHPAALARDLKRLGDTYQVDLVVPIDMFPSTSDLETVVILDRKDGR